MTSGRSDAQVITVSVLGALIAVLLGLAVVTGQSAVPLAIAAAVVAGVVLVSRSPAIDFLCFLALFSGPPRLRARDPLASLQGEIDWVVLLHLFVWLMGALWIVREVYRSRLVERKALPFTWIHLLAVSLAALLGLSLFESPGPLLTAFRALQMLVMILFGFMWVEQRGVEGTLSSIFWGYVVLAVVLVAAAVAAPDLVFRGERVRGDYIANASGVGAMGFILLVSHPPALKRWMTLPILTLFVTLLVFSLARSAYIVVIVFLALAAIRRPRVAALRSMWVTLGLLLVMVLLLRLMPAVVAWVVRDPSSLATFSDRIPLWSYLIPLMWGKSPLLGLGFYAASRAALQYNAGIGTAHSAFVEVLVGGGILGGGVFLVVLAGTLARSLGVFIRRGKEPAVFATSALLVAVLFIGLVSEEMVIASPTALTFWIVVSLTIKQGSRQELPLSAPLPSAP